MPLLVEVGFLLAAFCLCPREMMGSFFKKYKSNCGFPHCPELKLEMLSWSEHFGLVCPPYPQVLVLSLSHTGFQVPSPFLAKTASVIKFCHLAWGHFLPLRSLCLHPCSLQNAAPTDIFL